MDAETALLTLRPLADGIDPDTGELLPAEHLCQAPHTVRALLTAIQALEEERARERKRQSQPANAGLPWDETQDRELEERFEAGEPVARIARAMERSTTAIEARLYKLGKIEQPGERLR